MAARYAKRWLRLGTVIYEPTVCQDLVLTKKKTNVSVDRKYENQTDSSQMMIKAFIMHALIANIEQDYSKWFQGWISSLLQLFLVSFSFILLQSRQKGGLKLSY